MTHTLALDIGKTHAKAVVFDAALKPVSSVQRRNEVLDVPPYPHLDVTGLWYWILDVMRETAAHYRIARIGVATHGATAALVEPASGGDGLVLPVLDYEHAAPAECVDYEALRPSFAETLSPSLPAGLNLGRQLYWQQRAFPQAFDRVQAVLTYPQYWSWRLSGVAASECSSLGCHTDLWAPLAHDYSSLVRRFAWESRFPALHPAGAALATLHADIAGMTGLPTECAVHTGVHDSSAGYARHLHSAGGRPFVLVSTGTWVVCMASGGSLTRLDPARDMVANVDPNGTPVPCARFMGGREYATLCERLGADPARAVTGTHIQAIVAAGVFALPDFSGGSGPFGSHPGRILGQPANGTALATLYLALMVDQLLDLLAARGEVIIEGAFLANPMFCQLVAALRGCAVRLSSANDSVAQGVALLCNPDGVAAPHTEEICLPCRIDGLDAYRRRWRLAAGGEAQNIENHTGEGL